MSRFFFCLREGVGIFSRSGVAGSLTVLAFAVLAGLGVSIWTANLTLEEVRLRLLSMFEIEVYLKPGLEDKAEEVAERIGERDGVVSCEIITRDMAAQRFAEEYGSELFDLLGENPLPASIRVQYDRAMISREMLSLEAQQIGRDPDVDEVIYEGDLLERLERVASVVRSRLLIAAVIIAVIALFLTLQAVRVAGRSMQPWVRALVLVGGSNLQLKLPFVITGLLAGLTGGAAGVGAVMVIQYFLSQSGGLVPAPQWPVAVVMVAMMMLFGAITAGFAAPRGLEHKPIA